MSRPSKEKISTLRSIFFHIIAIVIIPLLTFIFLEAGLHLIHFGSDSHYLVPCETQGCGFYKNNRDFTSQFFSKHLARAGFPVNVPYHKAPGTYRIFVLGESAAAGYPIPDFSFSRMLGAMLKTEYPHVNFEIINTSIVAINSHVILRIAKEVSHYQPDMFILYIGNNEVVGPYGPGTVFAPFSNNLFLIRASIYLKSTRIGQLLQFLVEQFEKKPAAPRQWEGMAMFSAKQINQDDPRMDKVYQFYETNLNEIINTCRLSGAKVILSTVGTNIHDIAPFDSAHENPVGQNWAKIYDKAKRLQQAGHDQEAVEQFLLADHLDDSYAELHFRLGRSYEALGQFDKARASYMKARDRDTLRFRADSRINEIIRKIVLEQQGKISFVDSARNFEVKSPHGISGKEFFYEHVHMNFSGQYLLALSLWPQVIAQLPAEIRESQKYNQPVLSIGGCAHYLGYCQLEEYLADYQIINSLANRPPFINILNHQDLVDDLKQRMNLAQGGLLEAGVKEALQGYQYALKLNPEDPWTQYHLGRAYLLLHQPQQAVIFLRLAAEQMPSLLEPQRLLKLAEKDRKRK